MKIISKKENKKPKYKCVICGHRFEIEIDKKYVVKIQEGLINKTYYDAIDCPRCGCQKIIWKREEIVDKFVEKTKK